jgi:ABC-type transport system involved in cytochrome c biogenesis permease component
MRRRADVLTACAFFAIVASLFPLGLGPERLRVMARCLFML